MRHTILHADVMDGLASMPDESIQCVMTSPPYWGLRDYGIEGQIGLEPTPEAYVERLVEVFREVRRVLRDDGTLWLNLGDSYSRSGGTGGNYGLGGLRERQPKYPGRRLAALKPKNLVGIPWRVAFALQADGWYLRSDIIWHKPNPMPESVRDRPTKSHEHVFLLTKRGRYFYDADSIREPPTGRTGSMRFWKKGMEGQAKGNRNDAGRVVQMDGSIGRNRRDVWRIATQPTPEAHFATFPEKLVDPCIRAGASERGCCPSCGAPWRRVVERERSDVPRCNSKSAGRRDCNYGDSDSTTLRARKIVVREVGWAPTCTCGTEETVPCVVLDPFTGSGTVNLVAHDLGRSSVGIELNEEYIDIIKSRWARGGRPAEALEVRAI